LLTHKVEDVPGLVEKGEDGGSPRRDEGRPAALTRR
jgi:hypothetical protein